MPLFKVTKPDGSVVMTNQSGKWDGINFVRNGWDIGGADMPDMVLENSRDCVVLQYPEGIYRSEYVDVAAQINAWKTK